MIARQLCRSEQAAGAQRSCVGRSLGIAGGQGRAMSVGSPRVKVLESVNPAVVHCF